MKVYSLFNIILQFQVDPYIVFPKVIDDRRHSFDGDGNISKYFCMGTYISI